MLTVMLLNIVFLFEFGSNEIAWIGLESALLIAILIGLITLFIVIENRMRELILALHLIHSKSILMACLIMLTFGIAMVNAMTYSSLFVISILSFSTIETGEYTWPWSQEWSSRSERKIPRQT